MSHRFLMFLSILISCLAVVTVPANVMAQGGIVASTNYLNIGSFCPGESGTGTVTLTNQDLTDRTISSYEFLDDGWGLFALLSPTSFPYLLGAGESVELVIQFTPDFGTSYVMTLRIYTTSGETPILNIFLFGDGYGDCPTANDGDSDGIEDASDNCPFVPNGPVLGTCTGDSAGEKCYGNGDCTLGGQCSMSQEDSDRDGRGDVCDPFDLTISPEKPGPDDEVNLKGKYNGPVQEPGIRLIINRHVVEECEDTECEHTDGPFPEGMAYMAAFRDTEGEWKETDEMYAVRETDPDWDDDGLINPADNCMFDPNGPDLGTCTRGVLGRTCTSDDDCWPDGFCSMAQEDSEFICLEPDPHGGCNTIPQMGDGHGDACDDDDDDDGCLDAKDANPQTSSGDIEMGIYLCLPGGFGDGVAADCDNCPDVCNPDQQDRDGDGLGDHCDNCPDLAGAPQTDTDNDLVGDACDNCPNDSNINQTDTDGDGAGDTCDDDDDNDLCLDFEDDNPTVFSEDTDGDGLSNDCDEDDDNDGHLDFWDDLPLDATEWQDPDHDGIGNNTDLCPLYAHSDMADNIDSDGDGEGDACDCDDLVLGGDEESIDSGGACPEPVECTWCGDNIEPLRLRGRPNSGYIDMVFVPHTSWEGRLDDFREYAKDLVRKKFMKLDTLTWQDPRDPQLIEPIPEDFRDRFNFYIDVYGFGDDNDCEGELPGEAEYQEKVETCILSFWIKCEQDEVVHFWDYASFADVGALIADPYVVHPDGGLSGCARPLGPPSGTGSQFYASVLDCNDDSPALCVDYTFETALHEAGHSVFGLIDEYDGDTNYDLLQQYLYNEEPSNVWRDFWGSRDDPGYGMDYCEDFAVAHGLDPFTASPHTGCRHFTSETILPYVRFDRDDDCIMEKSRGQNSIFREACTWVITDVFHNWPRGRTKGILTYLEFDGQRFEPLYTKIVENHPDIYEKTHAVSVEVYSADEILLKSYGISDPRIALGEPAVIRDTITFPLFAAFADNIRRIILRDLESQGIMGEIDLAPAIYKYCIEANYMDPYCETIDLDGNGILDALEPEDWNPDEAVDKVCFPELDPPQCLMLDMDYDGVFNSRDNCPNEANGDQADADRDGYGDVCDNCPFVANPGQEDTDANGIGDACEETGDADGDGIPDTTDQCPSSDLLPAVLIASCNTGVTNRLATSGCSFSDMIGQCSEGARNHGAFVRCVSKLTNGWKKSGIITGRDKGAIQNCAAKADLPQTGECPKNAPRNRK